MIKSKMNKKMVFNIVFWICVLVYLIIQHSFVWLYFDDYGYASITYLGDQFNPQYGREYGLSQIFGFLKYHYLNWGGRVVPYFFEVICLRNSIWIFRIIQSILILLMLVFMVRVVDHKAERNIFTNLLIVGMYFLIGLATVNWGTYWFSASVAYIWSSSFFFMGMYFQLKYKDDSADKKHYLLYVLFMALSASMYEQASVAVVVYLFFTEFLVPLLEKKVDFRNFVAIAVCYSCAAFCIFSPGNFSRMGGSEEFNSLSLFGKIAHNLPYILVINLDDHKIMTVLFVIIGFIAGLLVGRAMNNKIIGLGYMVISSLLSIWMLLEYVNLMSINRYSAEICWVVLFSLNVVIYYVLSRQYALGALYIAGLMTQGMMLLTTQINFRVRILFVLIMIVICVDIILSLISRDEFYILRILIVGLFVCGLWYTLQITHGYYLNNKVNARNDEILRNYEEYLVDSEDGSSVELYKLIDDSYACVMPYQEGFEFGGTLMKKYYAIPQDVTFNWVEYKE